MLGFQRLAVVPRYITGLVHAVWLARNGRNRCDDGAALWSSVSLHWVVGMAHKVIFHFDHHRLRVAQSRILRYLP